MATVKGKKPTQPTDIIFCKPRTNDGTKNLFIWFRLLGIIMPKRFKALYIVYSFLVHFLTFVITPMSFTLSYFLGSEDFQINHFLTTLQVSFNAYGSAAKFIVIGLNRKQLFKIEAILDKIDARIKYKNEIQVARKAIRFANGTIFFFLISYYGYSTVTFLGAVLSGRPPYSLYIPFLNWRDSTRHFVAASIIEFLLIKVQTFQNVCNDSYSLVYLLIIHCHLRLLIMRVQKIGTDPKCTHEDNKKELIQSIKDHTNITELCKIVIPIMSATYFIIFITVTTSMVCALINVNISNDKSILVGSMIYIVALFIQILPICYFVNYLTDEFKRLPEAIFSNNWIDQSQEFRKLTLFFMHRAQMPVVFNAGKIFKISLDTFVSIVKFSFSLYTLLNNMDLGSN